MLILFKNMNVGDRTKQLEYDEDYYENGVVSKKSCYFNYHWMPELTFRMAFHMIRKLNIREDDKLLDFGCAKGYLVKAFRFFDFECYGCDISEYAINNLDAEVRKFCKQNSTEIMIPFQDLYFDWIVCKDVAEHFEEGELDRFLEQSRKKTKKMFVVVPLGENNKYIAPEYAQDITHKLAKNVDWWRKKFEDNLWVVESIDFGFKRLKENWTEKYPQSNGFFVQK